MLSCSLGRSYLVSYLSFFSDLWYPSQRVSSLAWLSPRVTHHTLGHMLGWFSKIVFFFFNPHSRIFWSSERGILQTTLTENYGNIFVKFLVKCWKSWRYFKNITKKIHSREVCNFWKKTGQNFWILPFWSLVPPWHFGTLHQRCVKFLSTIFYSFWGRKYRIGIIGHRVAKTCKKSWKETFGTIGAKFRRKILSPGQNFWILPFWSEVPTWELYTNSA